MMAVDEGVREAWQPLRRLGHIEAAMAYAHALLAGNTQATFLLSLSGDIAADAVRQTMRMLAASVELLSCIIVERADGLWFARPTVGNPGQITEETVAGPVDGSVLLARETCQVLVARDALWRLHVVRESDGRATHLLLTLHHSVTDAETASRLLAILAAGIDGRYEPFPAVPLTMGVDAYAGSAARHQPVGEVVPLAFPAWAPLAERSTGVLKADFDPDDSAKATALARRHGVSVNALLAGLYTSAVGEATGHGQFNLFTAVSLRQRLVPNRSIDDPGCFITVPAILCAPEGDAIAGARHFAGAIAERIGAGLPPSMSHGELRRAAGKAGEAAAFAGIGMTNMGFYARLRQAADCRFLDYRPAVNRAGGNLALTLHVTRSSQTIDCTFTYPRPLLPDAIAEATSALMKRRLHAL